MKIKNQIIILSVLIASLTLAFADEDKKNAIKKEKQNVKFIEDKVEVYAEASINEAKASASEQKGIKKNDLIKGDKVKVILENNLEVKCGETLIFSENIKFSEENFKVISIENLKKSISENQIIILDLNSSEDYSKRHIPNALNGFRFNIDELGNNNNILIVVYFLRDDYLAWSKVYKILQAGYKNVCYLNGGVEDWEKSGGKVEVGTNEINTIKIEPKLSANDRLIGKEFVSNKLEVKLRIKEDERLIVDLENKVNDYLELISVGDLNKLVVDNSVFVIDLNTYENYSSGHISGAIHGYSSNVFSKLPKNKKTKVVFYFPIDDALAWSKVQSIKMADLMKNGFRENYCYFNGGLSTWKINGGKLEK